MYAAAGSDDLALFRGVAAPDFFAFDGGKRFDGDALIELVRAAHAAGNVFVWRVTEPQVKFSGDAALITYVNRGSVSDTSGSKSLTESPRDLWRLQPLRRWSNEQVEQVLT